MVQNFQHSAHGSFATSLLKVTIATTYIVFWFMTNTLELISPYHVIGVCLLSQSASRKHDQENKAHKPLRTSVTSQLSPKMCLPCLRLSVCLFVFVCLFVSAIKSCYFHYRINKACTCSRCVICVSCSFHLISMYYVRKGS